MNEFKANSQTCTNCAILDCAVRASCGDREA
jgi:hypothetical protein